MRCAVAAACSWLHSCSCVAIGSGSLGWETVVGTIVLERCVGCIVDVLFPRIAAIPSCQSLTRMLSIFQCIQPGVLMSTKIDVDDRRGTYLTLILVRVDELCTVAGDFGLRRSRILFGSV